VGRGRGGQLATHPTRPTNQMPSEAPEKTHMKKDELIEVSISMATQNSFDDVPSPVGRQGLAESRRRLVLRGLLLRAGLKRAERERAVERQRGREGDREGGREAQMVGRIATLKKTPTHTHNWVLQY